MSLLTLLLVKYTNGVCVRGNLVISYLNKPNVGHFSIFWRFLTPGCPSGALVLSQSAGQSAQVAWVLLCAQTHTWSLRTALRGWTQSQVDPESGGPCSTTCTSTMGDRRMVFGDGLEDIKVKLGEGENV